MWDWETVLRQVESQMDEEQVQAAMTQVVREKFHPHFDDIRQEARSSDPPDEVREKFESMPEETKDQLFHDTWGRLIAQAFKLRDSPVETMRDIKVMIRDPYTLEALLLIMDHHTIPADTQEKQKDLLSEYIHALGVGLMPEAYTREEVEAVAENWADVDSESVLEDWEEQVTDESDTTNEAQTD